MIVGWMLGVLVSAYFCLCDSWMMLGVLVIVSAYSIFVIVGWMLGVLVSAYFVFVIVGWMLGVLVSAYFCLCDSWMDVGCACIGLLLSL